MKSFQVIVAAWFFGIAHSTPAETPNRQEPTQEQIKLMIDRLASPNKKPGFYPDEDGRPQGFPKDYDEAAQKIVWKAYQDLKSAGPIAFPQLLEHVDDDRYSMTGDGGADYVNKDVGFICRWILKTKITPFAYNVAGDGYTRGSPVDGSRVVGPKGEPPPRPQFVEHLIRNKAFGKAWLTKRQTYPLWVIQRDALEWIIGEEAKDTKKFEKQERDYLTNLLRELEEKRSYIESKQHFFSL